MKRIIVYFIIIIINLGCSSKNIIIENIDKIKIDYVHLYVMTPMDVSANNFYQYFGNSVKSIEITNIDSIIAVRNALSQFFNDAEKIKDDPDVRLIITLYRNNNKQIITMGSTLLYYRNQGFIVNDEIVKYFGKVVKLDF